MKETIALYEERLSSADARRYELEDHISELEGAQKERLPSPNTTSSIAASAAEIDNETLRDQIHHLQKKVTSLEDILDEARVSSEREEITVRERIRRFKEKEDAMKKELLEGRMEVEKMLKSESQARGRVEEIEDALRESTSALEDARAEVEGLRAELAVGVYLCSPQYLIRSSTESRGSKCKWSVKRRFI
jgi:CAP-Gly domain-containing linker protein 1